MIQTPSDASTADPDQTMPTQVPPPPSPADGQTTTRPRSASTPLGELVHVAALQEIQDGYTAVTGLEASIVDANGEAVTQPSHTDQLHRRQAKLHETLIRDLEGPLDRRFDVPIIADGVHMGAIVLTGQVMKQATAGYRAEAEVLADRFAIDPEHREEFINAVQRIGASRQNEAVRFVYLLADAIAEVCRQQVDQQQRVEELAALYRLSTVLSQQRDLQHLLNAVAEAAAQALEARAASIRLLDEEGKELMPMAVYNLSDQYLKKGPVLVEKSQIDQQAMGGGIVYVADMATDPRTVYPEEAKREGLASILCVDLNYRGRPLGVMRIYSEQVRRFTDFERHLLQAVAQLAATAIQNARLDEERRESRRVRREVQLAADVQKRLLPRQMPDVPPFDVAGRYEPCFELGGDFFDFIPFEHTLGVTVGDVVGKGVAASLLMSTVRAAIRAHAEDTYDLDEVLAKVNSGLTRDTSDHEFATVFYGTLDAEAMRMTYCSAGHDPALLLRSGAFTELTDGGMILGVDYNSRYDKGLVDLKPGDILLIYTDGVPDAMNFNQEKFGRDRIRQSILAAADGTAQDIVNHVLWEVRRFVGLNRVPDDMTLVAIKVGPRPDHFHAAQ